VQVQIAINKTNKFGQSQGGDTAEIVERPRGGISLVLVDGQGSGQGAKRISSLVVNKAVTMIGDGARDGAVARAVHDYLYTMRHGKVSATLTILSVDTTSGILLITRNCNTPVIISYPGGAVQILDKTVPPIGVHPLLRPDIQQVELKENIRVAAFTDGIFNAGSEESGVLTFLKTGLQKGEISLQQLGQELFKKALDLEKKRPRDDMTLALLGLEPGPEDHKARSFFLSLPL